jgi:chromosome segregation ATPase
MTEGEGVNRRYLVSVNSLDALRDERQSEDKVPGQGRVGAAEAVTSKQDAATMLRELAAELGEARYRLGRTEARLELTAEAESTLRESLQRERERADRAERRAEELEARLVSLQEVTENRRSGPEDGDKEEKAGLEPQRRSWLYRFFYGP